MLLSLMKFSTKVCLVKIAIFAPILLRALLQVETFTIQESRRHSSIIMTLGKSGYSQLIVQRAEPWGMGHSTSVFAEGGGGYGGLNAQQRRYGNGCGGWGRLESRSGCLYQAQDGEEPVGKCFGKPSCLGCCYRFAISRAKCPLINEIQLIVHNHFEMIQNCKEQNLEHSKIMHCKSHTVHCKSITDIDAIGAGR